MISYTNKLLIAMPELKGIPFESSVIYLMHHDEEGAMGFIINVALSPNLSDLFSQMEIKSKKSSSTLLNQKLMLGGPIQQEHGYILHTKSEIIFDAIKQLNDNLFLTTSKDILENLDQKDSPKKLLITLGYTSWGPGQLEEELKENAWLIAPFSEEIIFDLPLENRWQAALESIGIKDINKLSGISGHD
ncbi:YqgE/AlgH family protein [Thiotrichales bacterium 19S11-10]|nr:YqgE/AlgH family protein [Thiotrichales bacterium 19S11-10]MCF6807400.1 YqgE/AlgH family protein [Thiotrichales bacterium 19S9-11]MCF6811369.1 YqgE/AlgH family protein [Thiotrichales bacterium 19S9-12]